MADNTRLNPGAGGDLVATDEVAGVKHQQVVVEFGVEGEANRVSADSGLPINIIAHSDNPLIDAFGRSRTSQASTLGDFMQPNDVHNALIWTSGSTGSGSIEHQPNRASTLLTIHTGSGDERIWQTKRHFKYQPGLSYLVSMTGVMGAAKVGVRRRMGYFNSSDGIFLQLSGSNLSLVKRESVSGSVVDHVVDQADWNLDTLDSLGSSSVALDISKAQIFGVDMQWLGVGRVRAGFFIDGTFIYAHEFTHSNKIASTYMSTPNLPIRFEIVNGGESASPTTLEQICFSVMSEGTVEKELGIRHSANSGIVVRPISNVRIPLISMRLQSGSETSAVADVEAQIVATSATTFMWEAILNPSVGSAVTASWTALPNSVVEVDTARSGTVSGGTVIASGYGIAAGSGQADANALVPVLPLKSMLVLAADFDGVRDELVIVIQNVVAGPDDFLGALSWRELI